VLKRILEAHDLDVDTAESAEDALDYLIKSRPDVIFMDHLMPGMDGFEAVSAIKKNPETATIPIMMYTSQEGEVYVGQARALGAVGVLPKKVAHVEVSKVLKSLHIIGGEGQEQADEQAPPTDQGNDELAELEPLNQDLRILIEDLFEQHQAVIRRDLLNNYEAIATRFADEIRPPPPQEPDEPPIADASATSGFMRVVMLVLVVSTITFAWLYWQREQSWREMQAKNAEYQQSLESQRLADAEDSLRALQQIDGYQQSLDAMYAATIDSLEWGANQTSQYRFSDLPLGDDRLKVVEQLTDQLLAISFSGVVRIEAHVGDYCMIVAESGGYALARDSLAVECDKIGFTSGEAYERGLAQSAAFANLIRLVDEQSGGGIRFEIVSLGNSAPLLAYPTTTNSVSASDWNQIAAANNRVEISVYPDGY